MLPLGVKDVLAKYWVRQQCNDWRAVNRTCSCPCVPRRSAARRWRTALAPLQRRGQTPEAGSPTGSACNRDGARVSESEVGTGRAKGYTAVPVHTETEQRQSQSTLQHQHGTVAGRSVCVSHLSRMGKSSSICGRSWRSRSAEPASMAARSRHATAPARSAVSG